VKILTKLRSLTLWSEVKSSLKSTYLYCVKKTIDQKPIAHVAQLNKMIINLLAETPTAPNLTRAVFLITLLEGDAFM
jgi:hypothetical protein